MPRYYFHIHNGLGDVEDKEGRELADLDAAQAEAVVGARSLIASEVLEGRLDLNGFIEVTSGQGHQILRVTYREAVSVEGEEPDLKSAIS